MRILLLFCLLISSSFGYAQKLVFSQALDFHSRNDAFEIIGRYEQQLVTYYQHGNQRKLHFYNDQMEIVKECSLDSLSLQSGDSLYFLIDKKKLSLFCFRQNRRLLRLYTAVMNTDYLMSDMKRIDSIETDAYRQSKRYWFQYNDEHSRLLIGDERSEEDQKILRYRIADADGSMHTYREWTWPVGTFYPSTVTCFNPSGSIYLLGSDRPLNNTPDSFFILRFSNPEAGAEKIGIDRKDFYLHDMHLITNDDAHTLYVTSWFGTSRYSAPRGLFTAVLADDKAEWTVSRFSPLTLPMSSQRNDLQDFEIRQLLLNQQGGVEILAEKYAANSHLVKNLVPTVNPVFSTSFQESSRTVTDYYFGELLVAHLRNDGSLAWSQTILKEQNSTEDDGWLSSFGRLLYPSGTIQIFNDLNQRQNRLMGAFLSSGGQLSLREIPIPAGYENWNLLCRLAFQTKQTEIIIPAISKNNLCYLSLRF
ncbi:MAG TPA: hypothetical protein PLP34_00850 [Chitinophagaceae bacterium]|nr:hypothetical protein [Chitinophagaceae bacterium]